jgi:hypothetical protein
LTVSTNGLISWTPTEAQGPSTNTVTVRVYDHGVPSLSATNSLTLTVNEVNSAPVLPIQTNQTISGLVMLIVTNAATDPDMPANSLAYMLLEAPTNAVIDTNGLITWTPAPDQIPSTNIFTTVVTDYNPWAVTNQTLSATNSFTVEVTVPIHSGPSLPVLANRTVDELTPLVVTNTATSTDTPPLLLAYQLVRPPGGARIDTNNGVITWTPDEHQGPGTYLIQTVVTDNGVPPLSATNSFRVTVNEVNSPPVPPSLSESVLSGGETFTTLYSATDPDWPYNSLTYQLIAGPDGAVMTPDGLITWTPASWQVSSTNVFTVVTTDYNPWAVHDQHLSATNSFTVKVYEPGSPPVIVSLELASGTAVISWSSLTGKTYRLQYKDSPAASNWSDLPPDLTATGSRATATNALENVAVRIYRVFQLP